MILDDIRQLRQVMNNLQLEIENFTTIGAIRYDKEPVQTSPSGDSLERAIFRKIEQEEKLEKYQVQIQKMIDEVELNLYTQRQQEFIDLYYFKGLGLKKCSKMMKVNIPALSKIKFRICSINSAESLDGN